MKIKKEYKELVSEWLELSQRLLDEMKLDPCVLNYQKEQEKQKVLTAEEIVAKSERAFPSEIWKREHVFIAAEIGIENGRFEKDLELREFFDKFVKYRHSDNVILSDLCKIYDNLKPLKAE